MSPFVWTDEAVRAALGLRTERARPGVEFTGVSTDSRSVEPGALYVALVGDTFNGHDFVADALAAGAAGAVVSQQVAGEGTAPIYPVDDTLGALAALAAHRRAALEIPVVGITGSAGKTTTKELTSAALGRTFRVHATRGNLNNRVGMPLTLLAVPADADVLVLEMGTSEPGEIAALAGVSRPDIAVLTTVGESHLEGLGSLEGVLQEKLDILRHRAEDGHCVVGATPAILPPAAREVCPNVRVAGWGSDADEDLRPVDAEMDHWGRWSFGWRGSRVALAIPGRHVAANALLALTVAELMGVAPADAARGISDARPSGMRGEMRRIGDLNVLVDCYNANPPSVIAALDVLSSQSAPRKVAVLGTMLELGDAADALHAQVLAKALAHDLDVVVATGGFARVADAEADDRLVVAEDWQSAYPALRQRLEGHEVVLLKASRGVAMEGLLPLLEADFGPADAGEDA